MSVIAEVLDAWLQWATQSQGYGPALLSITGTSGVWRTCCIIQSCTFLYNIVKRCNNINLLEHWGSGCALKSLTAHAFFLDLGISSSTAANVSDWKPQTNVLSSPRITMTTLLNRDPNSEHLQPSMASYSCVKQPWQCSELTKTSVGP